MSGLTTLPPKWLLVEHVIHKCFGIDNRLVGRSVVRSVDRSVDGFDGWELRLIGGGRGRGQQGGGNTKCSPVKQSPKLRRARTPPTSSLRLHSITSIPAFILGWAYFARQFHLFKLFPLHYLLSLSSKISTTLSIEEILLERSREN